MMKSGFDGKRMVSLTGMWFAMAIGISGCANMGQQDAGNGGAVPASGVTAAGAPVASADNTSAANAVPLSGPLRKTPPLVYRVKRGDTLARIAQKHHCSVGQLQAWNGLKTSSRLKLGQVVNVASPETVKAVNAAHAAAAKAAAQAQNLNQSPAQTRQQTQTQAQTQAQTQTSQTAAPSAADIREVAQQTAKHASAVALAWPAGGRVVEGFQPGETRGIEIGGKSGDPVRAAADGKVMYAGMGLNSYGSLIIVQHNKDFLTAYSHNRKLLVKTGDVVRQGQQIAEMGDEKNSRVSLGFELRHDGKPVDPMPYLPEGRG